MTLKQKIRNNELTLGTWLTIPHQSVVEILSTAGFEWITIDIEHSALSMSDIISMIGHIQGNNMKALVRIYDNDPIIIKRVLDAGADGIIVPMVKNREEAQQIIDSVYYPPHGKRGVGLSRAQGYGTQFDSYKDSIEDNIIIIAQIEHIDAINNLEEIISIPEIDATLIGPYDLSASMGKPGQYHLPEIKKAIEKYDSICDKHNVPKGAHVISSNYQDTQDKINLGYSFLAFSLDFFFLGDKAREEMTKFKR